MVFAEQERNCLFLDCFEQELYRLGVLIDDGLCKHLKVFFFVHLVILVLLNQLEELGMANAYDLLHFLLRESLIVAFYLLDVDACQVKVYSFRCNCEKLQQPLHAYLVQTMACLDSHLLLMVPLNW